MRKILAGFVVLSLAILLTACRNAKSESVPVNDQQSTETTISESSLNENSPEVDSENQDTTQASTEIVEDSHVGASGFNSLSKDTVWLSVSPDPWVFTMSGVSGIEICLDLPVMEGTDYSFDVYSTGESVIWDWMDSMTEATNHMVCHNTHIMWNNLSIFQWAPEENELTNPALVEITVYQEDEVMGYGVVNLYNDGNYWYGEILEQHLFVEDESELKDKVTVVKQIFDESEEQYGYSVIIDSLSESAQ